MLLALAFNPINEQLSLSVAALHCTALPACMRRLLRAFKTVIICALLLDSYSRSRRRCVSPRQEFVRARVCVCA